MFYRFPAAGFLMLRPDVQYIVHPSGSEWMSDALVGSLRFETAF
jgi:carbohydrate-selective porin OprB